MQCMKQGALAFSSEVLLPISCTAMMSKLRVKESGGNKHNLITFKFDAMTLVSYLAFHPPSSAALRSQWKAGYETTMSFNGST